METGAGRGTALGAEPARRGRRSERCDWRGCGDGREHVALQHLAALPAAGDRGEINSVLRRDLGRGRRRRHCRGRRRSGLVRRGGSGRRSRRRRSAGKLAEQRADSDRLTGLSGDLAQDARARRVDLERHFVGFQFNERLVGAHRLSSLLEPFADGRLADQLAQRRNTNFNRHFARAARRPSVLKE